MQIFGVPCTLFNEEVSWFPDAGDLVAGSKHDMCIIADLRRIRLFASKEYWKM